MFTKNSDLNLVGRLIQPIRRGQRLEMPEKHFCVKKVAKARPSTCKAATRIIVWYFEDVQRSPVSVFKDETLDLRSLFFESPSQYMASESALLAIAR